MCQTQHTIGTKPNSVITTMSILPSILTVFVMGAFNCLFALFIHIYVYFPLAVPSSPSHSASWAILLSQQCRLQVPPDLKSVGLSKRTNKQKNPSWELPNVKQETRKIELVTATAPSWFPVFRAKTNRKSKMTLIDSLNL